MERQNYDVTKIEREISPNLVRRPSESSADSECNCSMAKISVSIGGGSMKSKARRSLIPIAFKLRTLMKQVKNLVIIDSNDSFSVQNW